MNQPSKIFSILIVLSLGCFHYAYSAEVAVKGTSKATATNSKKLSSTPTQFDVDKVNASSRQQSNTTGARDCTKAEDQDYSDCRDNAGDTNIDDATETHRLKTEFLGEQWIVSGMATQSPANSTAKQAASTKKTINQKTQS